MTTKQLAKAIVTECRNNGINNIQNCSCLAVSEEILGRLSKDEIIYSSTRGGVGYKQFSHLFPAEIANKEFQDLRAVFDYLDAKESFNILWVQYNSFEESDAELREHCEFFWMKSRGL